MRNFKDVPLPKNMLNCEIDPRGLPVPFVVFSDEQGKFHFKVNDTNKQIKCIEKSLCHICGQELKDNTWMLGGPASAFDKNGSYIDGPIHRECGQYALQVCPYLAYNTYNSTMDLEKMQAQVSSHILLHNPTVDQDRVPLFVLGKTNMTKWYVSGQGIGIICVPNKPFEALEFWDNGIQLTTHEEIISRMKGTKWEKYLSVIENTYEDACAD